MGEVGAETGGLRDRVRHYRQRAMETYWALRRGRPWFDHLVRAYERYADRQGNQLAASVTYFAFLSFFPLIALAFAVVGYAVEVDPNARSYLETAIDEQLPGLSRQLPIEQIAQARTGAGAIGLIGLAYTGLGAVGALREALHTIWLKSVSDGPNFLVAKAIDLAVTAVLGAALLASVALTGVAQAATGWLLGWVGLDGSFTAAAATRLLGLAIAIGADLLIFLVLFSRLSGTRRPWRLLWRGALLAAVGFEVLKAVGALLIGGTLTNPVYASFAVLVGLLVWLNIVLRMVVFAAAWTATWLPVPPPYQGAVPVDLPVGRAPAGSGLALVGAPEPAPPERSGAERPDSGAGRKAPARHRGARPRARGGLLRRVAPAAAATALGAACAAWWLRYRRRK
ncbi:YihY/virulence factor BrkB family protein [Nocardiopsis sp. CNT-189]|uniref:YihY/virulence factor BrkB family protein n=1 Tax=Nocardiopsis oceanisediminis TaxID=2816862 RepID=UPI003B3B8DC8